MLGQHLKKYAVQKLLGQHVPITEGGWIRNLRNQARPVAETQEWWGGSFIGDPTFFNWDLLVLSWSSYSYFDQFIISLRTHMCSAEEFTVCM